MSLVKEIPIVNKLGLHLRAAAQFVQTANKYRCDVWVTKDERRVNGKSIMGVMTLVAAVGSKILVECDGEDGEACIQALEVLAAGRFGEKE
ncbi:MAG: HPr family phosphocarrier protein [candidate division FCPU426 bacterium]